MKTSTLLYLMASMAASSLFSSCTYEREKKDEAEYGKITGDTLDTGADPGVQALENDSFARTEALATRAATTDTGSTMAYTSEDTASPTKNRGEKVGKKK